MTKPPPSRPNPYRAIGIVLLVTPFVFGIVLFTMAATVVDEQSLEESYWAEPPCGW